MSELAQNNQTTSSRGVSLVDLHLHTTASDGILSPAALVRLVVERGLKHIAITDHDSVNGIDEARAEAAKYDLEVIPGIEFGTDTPDGEIHILAFFVDDHDPHLNLVLKTLREGRVDRGRAMVERLGKLGLNLDWDRVQELAQGAVGRPHIARAMVEKGYVKDMNEAFDKYIYPGSPAYVERYKLLPQDVLNLVEQVGGVASLAHPYYGPGNPEILLPDLVNGGLVGMECYYGDYDEEARDRLLKLADRFNLIPTGGTDYHGFDVIKHTRLPGGILVPSETVVRLKQARDYRHNTNGK